MITIDPLSFSYFTSLAGSECVPKLSSINFLVESLFTFIVLPYIIYLGKKERKYSDVCITFLFIFFIVALVISCIELPQSFFSPPYPFQISCLFTNFYYFHLFPLLVTFLFSSLYFLYSKKREIYVRERFEKEVKERYGITSEVYIPYTAKPITLPEEEKQNK
jgi:hypothetical protein